VTQQDPPIVQEPDLLTNINHLIGAMAASIEDSLQKQHTKEKKPLLDNIKEIVGVITGISAVIVASLWYFGRNYRKGYSDFVNIPLEQLNFSMWDYGEDAWVYLGLAICCGILFWGAIILASRKEILHCDLIKNYYLYWFIGICVIISLALMGVFSVNLSLMIRSVVLLVCSILAYFAAAILIYNANDQGNIIKNILLTAPISVAFMIYLLMAGNIVYDRGVARASFFLAHDSTKVIITTSNAPIAGITSTRISNIGQDVLFQYKDMYLLTYNDKRYYHIKF
jgi:hypothetical protein